MSKTANAGGSTAFLKDALSKSRSTFLSVWLFSAIINVLALTGSFYMLQIYDRVLPSRSLPTLAGLTALMVGLYLAFGLLDFFRVRVMSRIGAGIDESLRGEVFEAVRTLPLRLAGRARSFDPVRDLDQVRSFLSGLGPAAFLDLPWVPIYLGVVYLLHPALGLFAAAGALILACLALLTEAKSAGPLRAAATSGADRLNFERSARRNSEVICAMGLGSHLQHRWNQLCDVHVADQLAAADAAGGVGTVSKVLRLVMQSGILGLGAFLVIRGEVSAGTIVASSIIMSRALAPIESAIGHWRGFVAARQSFRRLGELFASLGQDRAVPLSLPSPVSSLEAEALTVAPPGETRAVITGVSFKVAAGEGLGIVGPSGSGKSTLARALVGVWQAVPMGGAIRLDGAPLHQWSPAALGRHIGYLPQDIELLEGTVAQNIARFDEGARSECIVAAARAAGVHELILRLPDGYQSEIGDGGRALSAGQRQRMALARALYGEPFLVVLDEPNSNLDADGETALLKAVAGVRQRGGIVVVIAHRPSALQPLNKVLVLANGRVQAFGDKDKVLQKTTRGGPARRRTPEVVSEQELPQERAFQSSLSVENGSGP
jgi:ATP-binding cassette, subfamily C, type I secretion system permease/ATPase